MAQPEDHLDQDLPPESEREPPAVCTRHNEKIFCRTDLQFICSLCSMDEHRGHDTVSAAAEMTERQKELGASRRKIQQRIQTREKELKLLQQEVEAINLSADKAVEDSEKIFTELIRLIKRRSSEVKQQVRSQQKSEVSPAMELQRKLEQELDELRGRDAALEQLSHTEDHTEFLPKYFSLSRLTCLSAPVIVPRMDTRPLKYFEDVITTVSEARAKLMESCKKQWDKISVTVTKVDVLLPHDPKTRADCSKYAVNKNWFKLDPNTASKQILLTEENRKATSVLRKQQPYPRHPDRFMDRSQVVCKRNMTSWRCYWEVEWSGLGVSVAVAYRDIARTGEESTFGNNAKSWALQVVDKRTHLEYTYKHNNEKMFFISNKKSSRVGVYLDHSAGVLSFYRVSKTMTLLLRVQTTFTQPLCAGLGVYYNGSTAEFCDVR